MQAEAVIRVTPEEGGFLVEALVPNESGVDVVGSRLFQGPNAYHALRYATCLADEFGAWVDLS